MKDMNPEINIFLLLFIIKHIIFGTLVSCFSENNVVLRKTICCLWNEVELVCSYALKISKLHTDVLCKLHITS